MAKASDKAPVFSGEFRHAMDEKKRVTIPARWRSGDTDQVFIVKNPNRDCLTALPAEAFERIGEEAKAHCASLSEHRVFMSHFYSQAARCTIDKQGRLLLPDELCSQARLDTELVLIGSWDRFEIWNPERW